MEYNPNVDQFDLARKRAEQQNSAQVQTQQDALKRRFAAAGALNSGAAIKTQEMVAEQGNQNLQQAHEGINAQQSAENQRQKEVVEGRDFARSERLGSQEFAKGERIGSQEFGAGQAELQRKWSTGERLSSQDYQSAQADITRKMQESQFGRSLEAQYKQLSQDQWANEKTYELGKLALEKKDLLERLLGNLMGGGAGPLGGAGGGGLGGATIGGLAGGAVFGPAGTAIGAYQGYRG